MSTNKQTKNIPNFAVYFHLGAAVVARNPVLVVHFSVAHHTLIPLREEASSLHTK